MAMYGHASWSHDIGGFHRQPTPDLYARWAQFGLFSPLSRAHGMTTRLPWDYGEDALRIFRDYTRLRYRFLPYIFTYAAIAAETGLPLMRPMVLEFPEDPNTHNMDLQCMFGSELLVAPIYNSEGRRPVYLPAGHWVHYWTREVIEGPQTLLVEAPLDVMPLYVRANSLTPTIEPQDHLTNEPFDFVIFDAYLLEGGAFELRDSDGTTRISASISRDRLEVVAEGVKRSLGLDLVPLPSVAQLETVTANGETLERREISDLTPTSTGGWSRDEGGAIRAVIPVRHSR